MAVKFDAILGKLRENDESGTLTPEAYVTMLGDLNSGTTLGEADVFTYYDAANAELKTILKSIIFRLFKDPKINSFPSGATTIGVDCDTYTGAEVSGCAGAITIPNPTGTPTNFRGLIYKIKDNGSAQTITYGNKFIARGVALPSVTIAGKTTFIGVMYSTATQTWDCTATSQEA